MSISSAPAVSEAASPRVARGRRAAALEFPALDAQTVLSCDLFDTLITRTFLQPTELFALAARGLRDSGLWSGSSGQWREKRAAAERALRAGKRGAEVTLAEIYQALGAERGWTAEEVDTAISIEAGIEFRMTSPVRRTIDWFNAAAEMVRHRMIICDTYFPRWMIERLLHANGVEIDSRDIHLSSELGKTKAAGTVYPLILRRLPALATCRILHVGDSEISDVRNARSAGLASFHLPATQLRGDEIGFADNTGDPPVTSAIAGATRAARLLGPAADGHRRAVWQGGAEIGGPLVTGFVLWTLLEARRRGLPALHFLARDGQIMCAVARRLLPLLDRPVECRYLYASRQALFLPSVRALDATALDWMLQHPGKTTLATMLARVDLDAGDCADALAEAGLSAEDGSRLLDEIGVARAKALLLHPRVSRRILATAAERRLALLSYLEEVGFWSGGAAIVDVGWHGRLQLALGRALAAEGRLPGQGLLGFYLSLYLTPSDTTAGEFVSYMPAQRGIVEEERHPNGSVVEIFFAADHGSLRGYERDPPTGRVVCALREARNSAAIAWGAQPQQAAILAFAEILVRNERALGLGPEALLQALKPFSTAALQRFLERPTRLEAETYGCFPHSEDQSHAAYSELAPRQAIGRIVAAILRPHRFPLQSLWREGTISRSVPPAASGGMIDAFAGVAVAKRRMRAVFGADDES